MPLPPHNPPPTGGIDLGSRQVVVHTVYLVPVAYIDITGGDHDVQGAVCSLRIVNPQLGTAHVYPLSERATRQLAHDLAQRLDCFLHPVEDTPGGGLAA